MKNKLNKIELVYKNNLLPLNPFKTFKFEISNNSFPTKFFLFFYFTFYLYFLSLIFFFNFCWESNITLK